MNASILSQDGLSRISQNSEWAMLPTALFLWALILVGLWYDNRCHFSGNKHFLVDTPDLADPGRAESFVDMTKAKVATALSFCLPKRANQKPTSKSKTAKNKQTNKSRFEAFL